MVGQDDPRVYHHKQCRMLVLPRSSDNVPDRRGGVGNKQGKICLKNWEPLLEFLSKKKKKKKSTTETNENMAIWYGSS